MSQSADQVTRPPDVIVVLTTQWRHSAFGFAGDPNAKTPRLDALASEGLWIKQAVTPHPFGVFARAAFLTATLSPRNGVCDYYDALPADSLTLAHAFSSRGYETAFFGKWQLYERDPRAPVVGEAHARIRVPESRRGGFDFWEGFESGFLLNDPLLHGTELLEPTRFPGYQSDVLVDRFLEFRRRRSGAKPLFALISLDAPHPPYAAPAGSVQAYDPQALRLLEGTTVDPNARAEARRELAGYYAHIEATDLAVGRLVSALSETGGWHDLIFAFSSVHGDMHGVDGKFRKGWPNEEAVRIPLILAGEGLASRGVEKDLLFSLVDLGPTLLGLTGTSGDSEFGLSGVDLSAALQGLGTGPAQQELSMPSVPPFAKQCPYAWIAHRTAERTLVFPESGEPHQLEHPDEPRFED